MCFAVCALCRDRGLLLIWLVDLFGLLILLILLLIWRRRALLCPGPLIFLCPLNALILRSRSGSRGGLLWLSRRLHFAWLPRGLRIRIAGRGSHIGVRRIRAFIGNRCRLRTYRRRVTAHEPCSHKKRGAQKKDGEKSRN